MSRLMRWCALVLLAAQALCSVYGPGTTQAASIHSFNSAFYGYSLNYPASWVAHSPSGANDLLLQSPDHASAFAVQATSGVLPPAAQRPLALRLLRSLLALPVNEKLSSLSTTPKLIGGTATQVEARAQTGTLHRFAVVRVVGYTGYVFIFYGYGPTPPSIAVDGPAFALHNILASLTLTPRRAYFTKPSVYFGLYYPLGWQHVSYPTLGKIVENGPNGAVIFADFGHAATNTIDLRLLLLDNVVLMGKIQGQANFGTTVVDGVSVQLVQVPITDKSKRQLVATVADTSLNGFNYVFGGVAVKGSKEERLVRDAIVSAAMAPPALPPDTGAFIAYRPPSHHYILRRPAAWVISDHDTTTDAAFTSRDGILSLVVITRTGALQQVLTTLSHNITQGSLSNIVHTTPAKLGALLGQERVIDATIFKGLVQETHLIAATSGNTVYVLSWNFYTGQPNTTTLQKLARQVQTSFALTT